MIDLAKSKGYITSAITNGLLVDKQLDSLKSGNIDLLTVSYYPENAAEIKESFRKLSEFVPINITYAVSKKRLELVEEVLSILEILEQLLSRLRTLEKMESQKN